MSTRFTNRRVIRPDDLMEFFGCGRRQAQRYLAHVRFELKKDKRGKITLTEFCKSYDIAEEEMQMVMR